MNSSSLEQAIDQLSQFETWSLKTINRGGKCIGYRCVLWDGSQKSSATGNNPLAAVMKAISLLRSIPQFKVKR